LFIDYSKIDTVWEFLCGVLEIPKCEPLETEDHAILKWRAYTMGSWAFDQELNRDLVERKLISLGIYRRNYVFTLVCKRWFRLTRRMDGVDLSSRQADAVDYCLELLTLAPLPPEITYTAPQTVTPVHKSKLHDTLELIRIILQHKFGIKNLVFTFDPEELSDTVETINEQLGLVTDRVAVELIKRFVLLLELVGEMSDADACEYIDLTSKITSCSRELHDHRTAKVSTGQSLMWHALDRIAVVIERKLCN